MKKDRPWVARIAGIPRASLANFGVSDKKIKSLYII
jgi:hypothetical protein